MKCLIRQAPFLLYTMRGERREMQTLISHTCGMQCRTGKMVFLLLHNRTAITTAVSSDGWYGKVKVEAKSVN